MLRQLETFDAAIEAANEGLALQDIIMIIRIIIVVVVIIVIVVIIV